jgi:hypothetical protein
LLQRFEVSKAQANLWDGERDGLREAVKKLEGGMYGRTVLSWSTSAAVMYPNAEGKHQIENCLQTTIESVPLVHGSGVVAFKTEAKSCEAFLDSILHELQKSKGAAVSFMVETLIGFGTAVDNRTLYEKKGADKSAISVMPEV